MFSEDAGAILVVEGVIPTLCHLPQSADRDKLLSKLAECLYTQPSSLSQVGAVASVQDDKVSYKDALLKASLDGWFNDPC